MCGNSGWMALQMYGFVPASLAPHQEPFTLISYENLFDLLLLRVAFIIVVFISITVTDPCVAHYYWRCTYAHYYTLGNCGLEFDWLKGTQGASRPSAPSPSHPHPARCSDQQAFHVAFYYF